jgi:uncharacterized membrane protein YbhN (UPF0104 family)
MFFVFRQLELRRMEILFNRIELWYMVPVLLLYGLSKVISVFRCAVLLRKVGVFLTDAEAIKLYWVGMYYNQFLPGGIGGDAYKVILLNNNRKLGIKEGASVMLNDRIAGLITLWCMTSFLYYFVPFHQILTVSVAPLAAISLIIYFFFLKKLFPSIGKVRTSLIVWSFWVQAMQFAVVVLLIQSMHIYDQYPAILFVFGLSSVAANIPISFGGVGLREIVFLWGSGLFNLVPEQAVFISVLFYLCSYVAALPGLFWVFRSPFESSDVLSPLPASS